MCARCHEFGRLCRRTIVFWLERTVALAREGQYCSDLARSLVSLGCALSAGGETTRATASITEGLQLSWKTGHQLGIARAPEALARLMMLANLRRSVQLFGKAEAIRSAIRAPLSPIHLQMLHRRMGDAASADEWARGQEEPHEAVARELLTASFGLQPQ